MAFSTGCTTVSLNIPSSGTATYQIVVARTAPGFGTNASYAICEGGSDCPDGPEVATVEVGSGGSVSATTLNIYPDLDVVAGDGEALSILKDSPTDQGWNESEAIAECSAFLPPDSVYKQEMTLFDAQGNPTDVQRVYYSPSLANRFPASVFTDENGNQTTPGTFAMVLGYNLNSTSSFLSCAPQVGLQGK